MFRQPENSEYRLLVIGGVPWFACACVELGFFAAPERFDVVIIAHGGEHHVDD